MAADESDKPMSLMVANTGLFVRLPAKELVSRFLKDSLSL